jgi:hypothetical protein
VNQVGQHSLEEVASSLVEQASTFAVDLASTSAERVAAVVASACDLHPCPLASTTVATAIVAAGCSRLSFDHYCYTVGCKASYSC